MNPKIMKRPMFRMGGSARVNYQNGTSLSEIEKLIAKRARLRDESLDAKTSLLPLQILAGQPGLSSIRGIGDVVSILSGIGTNPETFGALAKLKGVELEKTKGELDDKIILSKLAAKKNKKFEFEKRLDIAKAIEEQQAKLLEGVTDEDQRTKIRSSDVYRNLEKRKNSVLREMSEADFIFQERLKNPLTFDIKQAREDYQKIISGLAEGGRVGFQEGTPNPEFTMPEPKPKEAVQDRQLNTLMKAAPALEDPNQARSMGEGDMYAALRRRLPQEITDDVVRLIAYNPEAFADFADIQDQSDVDSFNQKYNVQLVLPVENVT